MPDHRNTRDKFRKAVAFNSQKPQVLPQLYFFNLANSI